MTVSDATAGHLNAPRLDRCCTCGQSFGSKFGLESHGRRAKHNVYLCDIPGCNQKFSSADHLKTHQRWGHVEGHGQAGNADQLACAECNEAFKTKQQLGLHANTHQHSPFACICGKQFARLDVLHRHIDSFIENLSKFPCTACKRHRGKDGFRRKHHLVQHLRNYHKFDSDDIEEACPKEQPKKFREILTCPCVSCEAHRDEGFQSLPMFEQIKKRPFQSRAEYSKHMRDVHQQTSFPCPIPGCERVKERGYMREKDLMKHMSGKHPEAQYVAELRQKVSSYPCEMPGCEAVLGTQGSLRDHMKNNCSYYSKSRRGMLFFFTGK